MQSHPQKGGSGNRGNGPKAIPLSRPLAAIVAIALHLND